MNWKRRTPIAAVALVAAAIVALLGVGTAAAAPCAGQGDAAAPAATQERAMICLVNRARAQRGLDPLAAPASLARAAARKSADILRCDEFSHEACGREFTYWIERSGYRGCSEGENIAYGSGSYSTPRAIFRLWMHSSGHRRNILGAYEDMAPSTPARRRRCSATRSRGCPTPGTSRSAASPSRSSARCRSRRCGSRPASPAPGGGCRCSRRS